MKQVSIVSVAVLAFLVTSLAAFGQTEFGQAEALAGGVTPGDTPGFPVTLSEPGSYKLTSNLDNIGAAGAVVIEADDVFLDLAGFSIIGSNMGNYTGISAGLVERITVINGTVRDMGGKGMELLTDARVENVMIANNGDDGIFLVHGRVIDCSISGNDGNGIQAVLFPSSGVIRGNFIHSNGERGIYQQYANGGMIIDNHVVGNGGFGMALAGTTAYGNNVLSYNNGGGAQVLGGVQLSNNLCNGGPC